MVESGGVFGFQGTGGGPLQPSCGVPSAGSRGQGDLCQVRMCVRACVHVMYVCARACVCGMYVCVCMRVGCMCVCL